LPTPKTAKIIQVAEITGAKTWQEKTPQDKEVNKLRILYAEKLIK